MLYSIGYQKFTIDQLLMILKSRNIKHLLDVRSKPFSRKPGFSRGPLQKALTKENIEYRWKGDVLGGFSTIPEEEIAALASWQKDKTACLLCMEADYRKCHRHHEIAKRLRGYHVNVDHLPGEVETTAQQELFEGKNKEDDPAQKQAEKKRQR